MSRSLKDQFTFDAVASAWRDAALLAAHARFEAALALAQAECGLVPAQAARSIAATCVRIAEDPAAAGLDAGLLASAARDAGTLAIPFVRALTAAVAAGDPEAARWVHLGATSQDLADTTLALQAAAARGPLLERLQQAGDALAALADAHRATMMVGRTLLQPATPIPFGWKAAGWLAPLTRSRVRLSQAFDDACVLQFGGASGTRAALGGRGDAVAAAMASRLGLADPASSWHGARDGVARLGAELALLAGAMARIGRDLSLLMQAEVGEAFEPSGDGRGGSSAMPHKRNPVGSMLALQAGLRAPGMAATLLGQQAGEHERGLGTWQADAWTLGALFDAAGSAVDAIATVLPGLRIDANAMRRNLDATQGFVYAEAVTVELSRALGKPAAQAAMERICRDAIDGGESLDTALRQACAADPALARALPATVLAGLFDPSRHGGDAGAMIDRVLAGWRAR
jgi:3-carboxy-cis,cis-muconate cycloisomerase